MRKVKFGVRSRVLTIALVPGIAILGIGIGGGTYLIRQATHARNWSTAIQSTTTAGTAFTSALQEERRLSILRIAGDHQVENDLVATRARVDSILQTLMNQPDAMRAIDPAEELSSAATYGPLFARLPVIRQQVDSDAVSAMDAYGFYGQLTGLALIGINLIANTAPSAHTSVGEAQARDLFDTAEALSRAVSLSAFPLIRGTMPPAQLAEFDTEIGYYRTEITNLLNELDGDAKTQLQTLLATPQWQELGDLERAVQNLGANQSNSDTDTDSGDAAAALAGWRTDAPQTTQQLFRIYESQENNALAAASAAGDRTLRNSIAGAVAVLLLAVAALLVALWLSGRLTRRLNALRRETLDLSDQQLPHIMERLGRGETVDLAADLHRLDYGDDEIGQVGDAFNRAQLAAVTAAVTEAKTREGVKAVFLNIARRSQVVMHRLLEILDKAEYETENPEQLQMLFRLDHLATRERRNAENLIILGGGRPGRRWRTPVTLAEIVRGAVAETEDYHKVHSVELPELSLIGSVVADVVHLLAELVDNATSFSPPQARVEITGNVVGRGVVVEISDQGLGMSEADFERVNRALADPPDFSVDTLSTDSRLGLFVVAQLARHNDISVRLSESDYGGVRAIVLIPAALIAAETEEAPPNGLVTHDPAAS
jgi:hypothetical protein